MALVLFSAYPNPFNPVTNITFALPNSAVVEIKIYNLLGEEITTLVSEYYSAGTYTVQWDAGDLPSGMYLCRMKSENEQRVIKLLLMK
jgi:flagellar hook assembly protein FlgD